MLVGEDGIGKFFSGEVCDRLIGLRSGSGVGQV